MIIWLTGQPAHGKSTLADNLAETIHRHDTEAEIFCVDGDDLRGLLPNPGYDEAGRRQNIDRAQAIAAYLDEMGAYVIVSLIAPYRDQREAFKELHNVFEVYVWTDEIRGREHYFAADYEPPVDNFLFIDTGAESVESATSIIYREISAIPRRAPVADSAETS